MEWVPNQPVSSEILNRLDVNKIPTDIKINFDQGDISLTDTVNGLEGFKQKVKKFVLTPKTKLWRYGFNHNIWDATIQENFNAECLSLADQMVNQTLSDSTPENPNGLGHTIEYISKMKKHVVNEREYLDIQMKVTGLNKEITVSVPHLK